jgi:hypothetical protein
VLLPIHTHSADKVVKRLLTGDKYLSLGPGDQRMWLKGALDGIVSEAMFISTELKRTGKHDQRGALYVNNIDYSAEMEKCIAQVNVTKLQSILNERLAHQRLKVLQAPAALTLRKTLDELCREPNLQDRFK